jgi:hypothetical protein
MVGGETHKIETISQIGFIKFEAIIDGYSFLNDCHQEEVMKQEFSLSFCPFVVGTTPPKESPSDHEKKKKMLLPHGLKRLCVPRTGGLVVL